MLKSKLDFIVKYTGPQGDSKAVITAYNKEEAETRFRKAFFAFYTSDEYLVINNTVLKSWPKLVVRSVELRKEVK